MRGLRARIINCPGCDNLGATEDADGAVVPVGDMVITMSDQFRWRTTCPRCGSPVYGATENSLVVQSLVANGAQIDDGGLVEDAVEWLARSRH